MPIFLIDHKNGCGCEQVTADSPEEAIEIYRSWLTPREGDYEMSAVELVADTICGRTIQIDRSGGQGHCWRSISVDEIPYSIIEEIEGEIIDGGADSCEDFIASNGQHYRW